MNILDFYHWGSLCPISEEMIRRLHEHQGDIQYECIEGGNNSNDDDSGGKGKKPKAHLEISVHDVSDDFGTARRMNMFFPFLTVLNGVHRYYAPISRRFLNAVMSGEIPTELPFRPVLGTTEKAGILEPITKANYHIAAACTGQAVCKGCDDKVAFYERHGQEVFGFVNLNPEDGSLWGGAEYVPSLVVPYDIPKGEDIAFVTCVYRSRSDFDYKSAPLRALERYLFETCPEKYRKLYVISDEVGVFPNGDMTLFKRNG